MLRKDVSSGGGMGISSWLFFRTATGPCVCEADVLRRVSKKMRAPNIGQ